MGSGVADEFGVGRWGRLASDNGFGWGWQGAFIALWVSFFLLVVAVLRCLVGGIGWCGRLSKANGKGTDCEEQCHGQDTNVFHGACKHIVGSDEGSGLFCLGRGAL